MSTKYDLNLNNRYDNAGYENKNPNPEGFSIPPCGIEDLDKAVFDLFDKEMPLYYDLNGEMNKVPVIFATGERFALLRRRKPIIDKKGALILPLVSITRNNIENRPQKGMSNNQMFTHVIKRKLSQKDLDYRKNLNQEQLSNVNGEDLDLEPNLSLKPRIEKNIIETIEIPSPKYFGATYEIKIWSSFTQQMNNFLEAIMNSYTLNPGQQLKLESEKGYWFPAFVDSSLSQDTNYADYTDAERYIKYSMMINATGFIIAPEIENGKKPLRSFISAPEVFFEVLSDYVDIEPSILGPDLNDADGKMLDDLRTEDDIVLGQGVGVDSLKSGNDSFNYDKSSLFASSRFSNEKSEVVGERGTGYGKRRITHIKDKNGDLVPVMINTNRSQGETLYDQSLAQVLFNISSKDK